MYACACVHHYVSVFILCRSCSFVRPPGVFEFERFSHGSQKLLQSVVEATQDGALTIIGKFIIYLLFMK